MDLCAKNMECGEMLEMRTTDFHELRTLETLGFIVSTEKSSSICVKVNGYVNTIFDEHFFCIEGGNHET